MKRHLTTCILILLGLVSMAQAQGVNWNGLVTVDSVEALTGSEVAIPVRLGNNDKAIVALQIPMQYDVTKLSFDSGSFVGSVKPSAIEGIVSEHTTGELKIVYIPGLSSPQPAISVSGGTLVTLHFTVLSDASPGFTELDSILVDSTLDGGGIISNRVIFTDSAVNSLLPHFEPGGVTVQVPTAVGDEDDLLPTQFELAQNYPNPFNPSTVIEFALPAAGSVRLEVFNVLGQRVATLVDGHLPAGSHSVQYDAGAEPSGIYFYRLTHAQGSQTKKMLLVK